MATKLDKALKREIDIDGTTYTVTITPPKDDQPAGIKVTKKGFQRGKAITIQGIIAGETPTDS